MAIYDKASLVLIPSGTKTSKVYSQKPTNGDGDFTFSRSTAATRVNASGNIEKETQNLLLQSNQFDTTWSGNAGASVTSGQSGYDGLNNAWLLTTSAADSQLVQSISGNGIHTLSVYAKAGTYDFCRVLILSANTAFTDFDLANGTIGTQDVDTIDATITSVGSGWYRLTLTASDSAITAVRFYAIVADNDKTGTSGNIYIQDAQLEQGLVARDYIETTTTAIYGGITDNVPRLDYTDSSCPALLLEPLRTNLAQYSEYFETYSKTRVAFVHNATASPEGLVNAAEFNDTATSGTHFVQLRSGVVGGGVMSFFAKQNTHRYVQAGPSSSISKRVFFDLQDGVMATIGESAESYYGIEDYGNGWYRCYVAFGDLENPSIFTAAGDGSSFNDNNYTGDGSGVYIYGAQIEQDATYHTSYIPTYGSSVSRVEETCNGAGDAATFNSTEGVLYAEVAALANADVNRKISLNDGTADNSVVMFYYTLSNYIFFQVYKAGTRILNLSVNNVDKSILHKIAFKYKNSDYSVWIDGVELLTDSLADNIPANTLNKLSFDGGGGAYPFNGKAKQVIVFPTALSDAELATLTTI